MGNLAYVGQNSAPFIFFALFRKVYLNALNVIIPIHALTPSVGLILFHIRLLNIPLLEELVHNQLKAASLSHRIRFIKSLFRWAQDENVLNGNPAAKIKEPKLDVCLQKFLS